LERLGAENVRQRLDHAGPGGGAEVPGLEMTRSDVEAWLAGEDRATVKLQAERQAQTLWWAKAATVIAGAGIVVSIIIAVVGYIWPAK